MRLSALFVAACMMLIAASAGAAVYLGIGLDLAWSICIGLVTLMALGLFNPVFTRLGTRSVIARQLADLSGGVADLARQVAETGRRLAAVEGKLQRGQDKPPPSANDPLADEIGELGTLIKQLAETVAAHEALLAERPWPEPGPPGRPAPVSAAAPVVERAKAPGPAPPPQPLRNPAVEAAMAAAAAEVEAARVAAEAANAADDALAAAQAGFLTTIRAAVEANRVDLYLQPIVTLPQRKVRYYEAMSRLRTEQGEVLQATDFIAQAEGGGLISKIDNLVVFRCVQVVRRLLLKNREIGVFCNLSVSTLNDSIVFPLLLEFLDANRAIAPSLVLELTQSALREAGPMENESLAALAERGFRFSLDNLTDLRIEPRDLAGRGFRFVKIPASLLLSRGGTAVAADIHPADLADLLGRFGIDLVAEKIESEGMVVDLLDFDVRYGQGFLFSPPRPVRAEALQGIADRGDVVARDRPPEGAAPAPPPAIRIIEAPASGANPAQRTSGLAQLARNVGSRV
jgi:cyclic-di-GMP phosphodiesterase TipF (flagellum assembly factor)